MSTPPWSSTSTKRKTKSATPASRKRQRLHDVESTSSSRRRKGQQTLTQAQWVTSLPPSFNEDEMQPLDIEKPLCGPAKKPRGGSKKRDSTLTQMDFFNMPASDDGDVEDTMLASIHEDSNEREAFPQVDGTYESPKKPRKRKATPATARSSSTRKSASVNSESQQEYQPSKRKRKADDTEDEAFGSKRRTSRRLASKQGVLSDPVRNYDYFEEALNATPRRADVNETHAPQYALETKDTLDDDEELDSYSAREGRPVLQPHTPNKKTTIVLSSQSPESLPASTRRTVRKTSETSAMFQRTPLVERSINVRFESTSKAIPNKVSQTPTFESPKEMVSPKLPKRLQTRGSTRIEDSQANLWSIPSSSAPEVMRAQPNLLSAQPPRPAHGAPDAPEIPATSQAQEVQSITSGPESQETLRSLSHIVSRHTIIHTRVEKEVKHRPFQEPNQGDTSAGTGTVVRDFAVRPSQADQSNAPHLEQGGNSSSQHVQFILDVPRSSDQSMEEVADDADFGSPIANDTQFNLAVQHRVSSPFAATVSPRDPVATVSAAGSPTPRGKVVMDSEECGSKPPISPTSPLPVPRLVGRSNADTQVEVVELQDDDDSNEAFLPRLASVQRSSNHVSTTRVLLNDMTQRSSSPSLPSAKAITQRSVHPASLPHPSQMSTQEATQGFLHLSSFPQQHREDDLEDNPDKITIKESSSSHILMSPVPHYAAESQSQLNIDLGIDEVLNNGEEGDLDLDPPSLLPRPAPPSFDDLEIHATPRRMPEAGDSQTHPNRKAEKEQVHHEAELSRTHRPDREPSPQESPFRSSQSVSIPSSPNPPPLQQQYSPIPGFNNETQSNFTQDGHVTAAYIHRQHEAGILPKWFVPRPYQVPGYTRRK